MNTEPEPRGVKELLPLLIGNIIAVCVIALLTDKAPIAPIGMTIGTLTCMGVLAIRRI